MTQADDRCTGGNIIVTGAQLYSAITCSERTSLTQPLQVRVPFERQKSHRLRFATGLAYINHKTSAGSPILLRLLKDLDRPPGAARPGAYHHCQFNRRIFGFFDNLGHDAAFRRGVQVDGRRRRRGHVDCGSTGRAGHALAAPHLPASPRENANAAAVVTFRSIQDDHGNFGAARRGTRPARREGGSCAIDWYSWGRGNSEEAG